MRLHILEVCPYGDPVIIKRGVNDMEWLSIRKPVSLQEIEQVEKELHVTLPEDYKTAIGPINGGALRNAYVEHPQLGRIAYSRNVSLSKEAPANIYFLFELLKEQKFNLFPFAGVGNGDYFCFDLKKQTVVLYEHETDKIIEVCKTFNDLLDMIREL